MSNWSDSTSECYRNEFMFLHSILWIFGYKCNLFFAYFAANIRKNLLRILSNGILFFILQKNQWERLCNAVLMIGHSLWQYHFCKNNFLVNFRILVNFLRKQCRACNWWPTPYLQIDMKQQQPSRDSWVVNRIWLRQKAAGIFFLRKYTLYFNQRWCLSNINKPKLILVDAIDTLMP